MANTTISIPKTHLIMGLCLPLAVLLGYFLAEPMDSASLAVVFVVLSALAVPILMRWHHAILILSWNAAIAPLFLPGNPMIWMPLALLSLLFAILNRSVSVKNRFVWVPSISKPLLFFSGVVIVTAMLNGGIGIRVFGSSQYGGRGYFYVLGAVLGYFALTSQRIPQNRAWLYLGMFFLPTLTNLVGNLAYAAGPAAYFVFEFFPAGVIQEQAGQLAYGPVAIPRMGGLQAAPLGVYSYLLARYGLKGVLDVSKPIRLSLFVLCGAACVASGYRGALVMFVLTFFCAFCFEGLWRTRLLPILASLTILGGLLMASQAEHLPLVAQRALSFLPVRVDEAVRDSARGSTEWRVEMWKNALGQVPKYLIKGKGFAIDPSDLYMQIQSAARGLTSASAGTMVAGDYHNGPLSVLIPFGLFGTAGLIWLFVAGVKLLYHYHRHGNPALQTINTFLLTAFVAKIVFFLFVFGALVSDLCTFAGILGFAVSLNGAPGERSDENGLDPAA